MTFHNLKTYQVALLQAKAHRAVQHYTAEFLKPYGLTAMEWTLLGYIADKSNGGVKATDIAEAFSVDASLMTNTINKLVMQELVVRAPHPDDQRIRMIKLTDKGADLVSEIESSLEPSMLGQWLSGLSPALLGSYVKVLKHIIDNRPS